MKLLLSFNFLFFLFFCPFNTIDEPCVPENEAVATTVTRICDFPSLSTGGAGCASNALELLVDGNCNATGEAAVRVVNLATSPVVGEQYNLPAGVPSIYYNYSAPGQQGGKIGPINTFTFKGEYFTVPNGQILPIFEHNAMMSFDASQSCSYNSHVSLGISVTLTNKSGQLYPVKNYAASGEIFFCEVFMETCGECSPPPASCTGSMPPVYNVVGCGSCNGCANDNNLIANDEGNTSEASKDKWTAANGEEDASIGINVQPNPFVDLLTIKYTLDEGAKVAVEIVDFKGKQVYEEANYQMRGNGSLAVDTATLPDGIYFCKVTIDTKVFMEKIIKIKR